MKNEIAAVLAEIVHAGLEGKSIQHLDEHINFDMLLDIAKEQKMMVILLKPLLNADNITEEQRKAIKSICMYSFMASANQLREVKLLEKLFEENGLKYQFLKGSLLKNIYPNPDLRDMGDIDVLVDVNEIKDIDKVLRANNYSEARSIEHHDVYTKLPNIVLEVHRYLSEDKHLNIERKYFDEKSNNRLIEGRKYGYEYSVEEFYVFMLMHMARHFYERGCGIRGLVDIYVYKKAYGSLINKKLLNESLERFGINDFEKHMSKLTDIWLGDSKWDDFYSGIFDYMYEGGIYGKEGNGIWSQYAREKQVKNNFFTKIKLKIWYLFPSYSYMANYNPWLRGKPYLLPFSWVYRALKSSDKHVYRQNMTDNTDAQTIYEMQKMYKAMNFKFTE
ncbi:MAG: nucleotidyltransferase family protein [Butyrivibrio sp.]|nr:nucleotidyltransferase family protein [Butyrivibrio sp.]